MSGFSTIVDNTIVSPTRQNYDVSVTGNSTVSVAYSSAGIPDKVGLQVVVYNNSNATITLTAGTEFNNYTSYPEYCLTINQLQVPAYQSVTLITTIVGQDYTISAISAMINLDGGTAGNLIYQQAANNTTFLAPGTAGYVLEAAGANTPPLWNVLTTGNLSGGVAGSLLYQSAANTTAKSTAGTTFGAGGGSLASMNNSTTVGWNNATFSNGFSNTYSGGILTLRNPRAYTFLCTNINSGGSGNLYTYMGAQNIAQLDGNTYTVYNNNTINYVLTIQNIQNPNGWGTLISSFAGGANTITLYPNESVTFQQFNSNNLTIVGTSQSLGLSGIYTGSLASGASALSFTAVTDPNGWLTSVSSVAAFKPNLAGNYMFYYNSTTNSATANNPGVNFRKNGAFPGASYIYANGYIGGNSTLTVGGAFIVNMNGTTDYITVYISNTLASTTNYQSGNACKMTITLLN